MARMMTPLEITEFSNALTKGQGPTLCSYCGEPEEKHDDDQLCECTVFESVLCMFDRDRLKKIRNQ